MSVTCQGLRRHEEATNTTRVGYVHEQALLHAAARRHGLRRAEAVAERIAHSLTKGFPELIDPATGKPGGNPTQLWAIGAHVYFERVRVEKALAQLVGAMDPAGDEGPF